MSTTIGAGELPMTTDTAADVVLIATDFSTWEANSVCRELDVWPNPFAATTPAGVAAAQAICATCEKTYECLILGLSTAGNDNLLYGGLTYEQRQSLSLTPQMEYDIARMEEVLDAAEPWNMHGSVYSKAERKETIG